jgi:hypothetical protein
VPSASVTSANRESKPLLDLAGGVGAVRGELGEEDYDEYEIAMTRCGGEVGLGLGVIMWWDEPFAFVCFSFFREGRRRSRVLLE